MKFWTDILKEGDGEEKARWIGLLVSFVWSHPGTVESKTQGDHLTKKIVLLNPVDV